MSQDINMQSKEKEMKKDDFSQEKIHPMPRKSLKLILRKKKINRIQLKIICVQNKKIRKTFNNNNKTNHVVHMSLC